MPTPAHRGSPASVAALALLAGTALALVAPVPAVSTALAAVDQAQGAARFAAIHDNSHFTTTESGRIDSIYGREFSRGGTPEESAALFVAHHADVFGAAVDDLTPGSVMTSAGITQELMPDLETGRPRFTLVYYGQSRQGVPVFRADLRLLTRNEDGYPLVLARSALRNLGEFKVPDKWQADAVSFQAILDRVRAYDPTLVNVVNSRTVIWAGYDESDAPPRLAYEVRADNGLDTSPAWRDMLLLVDALTGEILFKESQVLHGMDVSGRVSGNATVGYSADTCGPEDAYALPHLRLTSGPTTVYTDANGNFVFPTSGAGASITSTLIGRYFTVQDSRGALESLTTTINEGESAEILHNESNSTARFRSEVNAYRFANLVRDHTLRYCPSYPTICTQLSFPVRVGISGSCNAFYGNNAINFYAPGGSCPDFAFGDIVHHEYGHHLVAMAGSGQGQYGEGMGDSMGTLISDAPGNGIGAFGNCSAPARTADNNINYPCSGAIHTCGQLISGCIWDTRNELIVTNPSTYRDIISSLAINAMLLHIGTTIAPSITIDFLTLDDDDSDITNGTPHYREIATGFSSHRMNPPTTIAGIGFRFPDGRPTILAPDQPTSFTVQVIPLNGTPLDGSAVMLLDSGAGFAPITLNQTAPHTYTATIPPQPCGSSVRFAFQAQTSTGVLVSAPSANSSYLAASAADQRTVFSDDFSTDLGWTTTAPGDSASTTGRWTRVEPVGTYAQPESDHTGDGGLCFVTGQGNPGASAGSADIDGGAMTLTSPVFDLSNAVRPRLSYHRWFYNHRGTTVNSSDNFLVLLSNDGGETWSTIETVGPSGAGTSGGWVRREFDIAALLKPTATMRLRFRAGDYGAEEVVEAGVDDVLVEDAVCAAPCIADWNNDGIVASQDFFDFLTAFFADNADVNHDGLTTSQDFFDFLAVFLGGC